MNPDSKKPAKTLYSRPVRLRSGTGFILKMALPCTGGFPILALGLELSSPDRAGGEIFIDFADVAGRPLTCLPLHRLKAKPEKNDISGFIVHADSVRSPRQDEPKDTLWCGKNEGRGFLVTGTADWRDYRFEADIAVHAPGPCGLLARWQGQKRHLALVKSADSLKLILNNYGETVLGSAPMRWREGGFHRLALELKGSRVAAYCDGRLVITASDSKLLEGGAGVFFEAAHIGVARMRVV